MWNAAAIATVAAVAVMSGTAHAACGKVTIAEMNWASAGVAAHVESIILSAGYGCDAELVPGDTVPTVTSMTEKGEPDIAPEIWINSAREPIRESSRRRTTQDCRRDTLGRWRRRLVGCQPTLLKSTRN